MMMSTSTCCRSLRRRLKLRNFLGCIGLLAIATTLYRHFAVAPEKFTMQLTEPDSYQVKGDSVKKINRIPAILHQTWISDIIPSTYVPYVRSWANHRPRLDYYYWTDANSLEFVARHYPEILATFRGYPAHLSRADAVRYMLLHKYGGIYADMDMMRLRDLAPLLNNSRELCYLSQERYEITRLYWGYNSSVMNAIMLSAPGHKFMEYVVKALPRFANNSPDVMTSTGPLFLQRVYEEFHYRSPVCDLRDPMCRCVAADPYDFMPQVDPIRIPLFRGKCSSPNQLKPNAVEACRMLDRIGWRNEISEIGTRSYTHHGFLHYGFENQRLKFASVANISSVRADKLSFGREIH
ncbi:hypothetical protein BOX15_Mlig006027g1 [Macrostomum lignano]|uniref:Uncharacterized protein n=1 Tax=Macrostomum lignano TaxID=282301 RepID=A0A267H8Z6_9PLAT|nr:hypothetical protein BOX15_Mlig006027g1 [Macrostomum lignano]